MTTLFTLTYGSMEAISIWYDSKLLGSAWEFHSYVDKVNKLLWVHSG